MTAHEIAFYETTAQVVVVLLIVIGIELRALGSPSSWVAAQIFAFMLVAMVAGELAVLIALYRGDANGVTDRGAWTALAIGLTLAFVLAWPNIKGSKRPRRWW